MAPPYVRSIQPRDAKEIFGNLSQTNHYQVSFGALPTSVEEHIYNKFGVFDANNFMSRKGGLLCSDASLPGSNLATGDVKDNFMGVPQEFAHTRLYADIDFTFYVDRDYTNLRVFEGWIDYISSGSGANELSDNYFRRMRYPETYKANTMYITKFEKDYGNRVDYLFVNAFPKLVNAIPVSYGGTDILKVSVSFNYDRYIMNPDGKVRAGTQDMFTDVVDRVSEALDVYSKEPTAPQDTRVVQPPRISPAPPAGSNTGTGRDGTFGSGTTGQGLPSNPNLRSVTSEAEIRDKRTYGNTVPEGSFNITPKVPIRNRRGRIIGYK